MSEFNYTVSVRLMPFNQEDFIREAMDSIMMQKTNFLVEVVIGDDFSTDKTLEILKEYKNTEQIHIKILDRKINDDYWKKRQELGRLYNFTNILSNCSGKYIAMLDGDDYWTDPLKLQKQVDFLEANPDSVACHHWQNYSVPDGKGGYEEKIAPKSGHGYFPAPKATVKEVFENKVRLKIRCTMFRNVIKIFPEWYYKLAFGDVPLSMLLGKHGNFGFIDESMAVYRQTGFGVSLLGQEKPSYVFNHTIAYVRIWEQGNLLYNNEYYNETLQTIYDHFNYIFSKYNYSFKSLLKSLNYILFKSLLPIGSRIRIAGRVKLNFLKSKFRKK